MQVLSGLTHSYIFHSSFNPFLYIVCIPSGTGGEVREKLSLVNESQVLVLHRPSVRHLLQEIIAKGVEDQLTEVRQK